MDNSYLKINDVLENNLPYVQSNFMCNPDLTKQLSKVIAHTYLHKVC